MIPSCRIATQEQCVLLIVCTGLLRDDGWGRHHSKIFHPKHTHKKKRNMKNSAGRSDQSKQTPCTPKSRQLIILHRQSLGPWVSVSFVHDISRGEVAILYHATRRDGLCWYELDVSSYEAKHSSKQRSVQRSRTSTAMEGTNRTRGLTHCVKTISL